jgi:hypothetical protein
MPRASPIDVCAALVGTALVPVAVVRIIHAGHVDVGATIAGAFAIIVAVSSL